MTCAMLDEGAYVVARVPARPASHDERCEIWIHYVLRTVDRHPQYVEVEA